MAKVSEQLWTSKRLHVRFDLVIRQTGEDEPDLEALLERLGETVEEFLEDEPASPERLRMTVRDDDEVDEPPDQLKDH